MSLDNRHPDYSNISAEWESMRDFYAGEQAVKDRGEKYLPATSGMCLDGMKNKDQQGWKDYNAYKLRAVVPDYIEEAVEILLGLLHQKEPTVELPSAMEPLREKITINGESLNMLLRRINMEQLITGRVGLLADLPTAPDPAAPMPYVALYAAESCINWDDNSENEGFNALNLVVLNESKKIRREFVWTDMVRYRVLQLGPLATNEADGTAVYKQGVFDNLNGSQAIYVESAMMTPMYRGKTLDQIPFVFINSKDVLAKPDKPPLRALRQLCEAIYRMEADYRQNLHMQSQDTLVVIGGVRSTSGIPGQPEALRTGSGARIDVDTGGDAKYIGVSSLGLPEQRAAIANDRTRATIKAGELIQSLGSQKESGEALRTRFAAQTATLNQIALSGAFGLQSLLRIVARWMGANPDEVKITPNTEFIDFGLDGLNLLNIMEAKRAQGLPISYESLHAILADRGLTQMDFKTEVAKIDEENKNIQDVLVVPPPAPPAGPLGAPTKPGASDSNPRNNPPNNPRSR